MTIRADQLLNIENKAAAALADPIKTQLQALMRELARRYVLEFGSVYARDLDPVKLATLKTWFSGELAKVDTSHIDKALKSATTDAWKHGYKSAHLDMRETVGKIPSPAVSEETYSAIKAARAETEKRLTDARKLVSKAERWGDLTQVMAKANQSVTTAQSYGTWLTNRVSNEAVSTVARNTDGVTRVIQPERDACVHCLAYAGITALPDEDFPGGLTYGEKPISEEPFRELPIHRWCRCRTGIIRIDDVAVPDALKREAMRSIVKGFALPSDSDKVRLKAVQKLLDGDPKLPATVLEKARREIKRGIFKSRPLPTKK